jgi:hypothetical protein
MDRLIGMGHPPHMLPQRFHKESSAKRAVDPASEMRAGNYQGTAPFSSK